MLNKTGTTFGFCHYWLKHSELNDSKHLFIIVIVVIIIVVVVIIIVVFIIIIIIVVIIIIIIIVIIVVLLIVIIVWVNLSRQNVLNPLLQLVSCGHVILVIHLQPHAVSILNINHTNLRRREVDAEGLLPVRNQQGEIIRVDPDDAEVRVICVLTCHLLQDFQELKTIWVIFLSKGNNMLSIDVILPDLVHAVRLKFPQGWPVMLFNEFNKLGLSVGLSRNGDGFLHEWLVEINSIHLQLQLLGDLGVKCGIEFDEGVKLLSSIIILDVVGRFLALEI